MTIQPVTKDDCGRIEGIEGEDIAALYYAVKKACPGPEGDALWEKIREKYNLGIVDCESWVKSMNIAITIWNHAKPKDCASVRSIFGV